LSFDLNFGRQDETVPSVEDLKEYFQKLSSIQANDTEPNGVQFWYQNEVTGVYCSFSYSPDDVDEELGQLAASGLSFNLNYIRPSFFAYETMPLVQRFCERFDLCVEDLQEETVEAADASHLIESWRLHNERAVRALSQEKEDPVEMRYLPEERATEWWRYTSIQKKIEDSLTEDLFVPTVIILEGQAKRPFTMIVWADGIAQFFPRCDYVLVQRDKKKLFGSKEEVGLVPFDAVMESISSHLDEYDLDGGSVKYLSPKKKPKVVSAIQNFTLSPIDLRQHTRLAADGFHDVNV
jgi:hypothetical protein